jgi:hypothetical protein
VKIFIIDAKQNDTIEDFYEKVKQGTEMQCTKISANCITHYLGNNTNTNEVPRGIKNSKSAVITGLILIFALILPPKSSVLNHLMFATHLLF